jgi:phage baseplate assembly protein W
MLLEEAEINSSLEVLLSTATGERVMLSGYGCDLREFLFEPLTTTLKTLMSDKIKKAILYYEPRIVAHDVLINQSEEPEGKISIKIEYTIRTTNSRFNYVYDYYITEGAEIRNR